MTSGRDGSRVVPGARALDGALPARVERLALVLGHARLEDPSDCTEACSSERSGQKPTASPASAAAPSAVTSSPAGRCTGTPSTSAWNCIRKSFAQAPPSTRSSAEPRARSPRHALDHVAGLVGDRLERRADEVLPGRAARQADDRAARALVPVGSAEPDEGRHQVHAARIGHARAPAPRSRRRSATRPRPSRSHCTAAPATKMLPSSAYSTRPADAPGDGRDQPGLRARRLAPVFISRKQPVP